MNRDRLATTTRIDMLPDGAAAKRATQHIAIKSSAAGNAETHYRAVGGSDFQQLLDSVYDAALITDTQGTIRDCNGRACQFLKYDHYDLLDSSIIKLFYGSDASLLDDIQNSLESDKYILIQAACIRSDGTLFPAEISVNRLRLENIDYFCFFIRDITIRQQAEDRLRTGYTAIQNAANGIGVADLNGAITYVNTAMLGLWGLDDPDALLGYNIREVLCDDATANAIQDATSRHMAWEGELACETANGNVFYVKASVAPNTDTDGNVTGMVFSLLDITAAKRTAQKLKKTLTELEPSNTDLEQFAYAVSHDLQAPLRKLSAFTDIIRNETESTTLSPTLDDALNRVQHAAQRMMLLIQGLLRYSRITTREQPHEALNLNTIVEGVLSDLDTSLRETNGTVNVAPLPQVAADPTQMRQLFQNLIGNALRFHKPDTAPIVDISAETEGDDPVYDIIHVRDNGIGFATKDADRIFGVFQRLHSDSEYEGTGIGLAICRKIVERHGGRLTATATPGEGACFTITLPQQPMPSEKGERS